MLAAFASALDARSAQEDPLHAGHGRRLPAGRHRAVAGRVLPPRSRRCIDQAGTGNDLFTRCSTCSPVARCCGCVFALGIMPYITARIIIQLLGVVIPRFEQLKKQGQAGQAKLTQYTRYLTIGLAILQSHRVPGAGPQRADVPGLPRRPDHPTSADMFALVALVLTMTAGTAAIMWMGELITDRGIGNGMSILIFTSIAARIPAEGRNILATRAASSSRVVWCSAWRSSPPWCSSSRASAASRCSTPSA